MKQSPQPLPHGLDKNHKHDEGHEPSTPPLSKLPLQKIAYIAAGIATFLLLIWAFRPVPLLVDLGQVQRGELQVTVDAEGKTRVRDCFVVNAETDGHLTDRKVVELNETTKAKDLETAILAAKADASDVEVVGVTLAVVQQEQSDPGYLLKVYDARIASTEAELSKLRGEADRTDIRSPVAGKILRIRQKSAQFVTDGTPLIEIGDPTKLELVIDVLSTDAEKIEPGNPILIDQGLDQSFGAKPLQATVRLVELSAFTKVSALGAEEQRVNVIGDFVDAAQAFGDAYRVDTRIVIWAGKNILKAPICSLFRCNPSAWCVFVVENGKAHQRPIAIGHRSDREAGC